MTNHNHFFLVLGIAVGIAGCVEPELGETESELSVSSWSAKTYLGSSDLGAASATVNGTTVLVRSSCCDSGNVDRDLAWAKRTTSGWTSWTVIPGQTSRRQVSLAAFNGSLYMIRSTGAFNLAMSRFDPSTSTWTQSWSLPYQSYMPPAIVAFQNKLWIIGNDPSTYQMWTATMTTDEVLSTATLAPGKYTQWRPSAAVFYNRLYVAHAQLSSNKIIYASSDGTTWTPNAFLLVGPNATAVPAVEPVIAAVNGFLHIAYRTTTSSSVKWSYMDRCGAWTPEVSIGPLTTNTAYSLAQGGRGLFLTTRDSESSIYVSEFTAPATPMFPPPCSVNDG